MRNLAQSIVETIRHPLLILDRRLHVQKANPPFYRIFGVAEADTEGQLLFDLGNRQWDIPRFRRLLEEVLNHDRSFEDFSVEHDFPRLGRRVM